MTINYHTDTDSLYVKIKRGRVHKTIEGSDTFLIDVDRKGGVIGIEILDYSKGVPQKSERSSITFGQKKISIPV